MFNRYNTGRKWFTAETLEELKAEYKQLTKAHHPDLHHDDPNAERDMAEINAEFDRLHRILPATNAKGERYQPKDEARGVPEEFRAAVEAVLKMDGVTLELCGSWLWATGETRRHKDGLKAAGYRWSQNKQAWYWHAEGYRKHRGTTFTLDEIRDRFGSRRFEQAHGSRSASGASDEERERIAG